MAVVDRVNRRGLDGRRVITGPGRLGVPLSGDVKSDFYDLGGMAAHVDRYPITTTGTGVTDVAYTLSLGPFSENGLRSRHRSVGAVALLRQAGGIASPTAAITCLGKATPSREEQTVSIGPVTVNSADRLWAVVEWKDQSTLKYQLVLDVELITISAQPPNRSIAAGGSTTFTVTASTNDGGSLAYQWQISADSGATWSNITAAGVYSNVDTATLAISNVTGLNGRRYRVRISSNGGSPLVTSNAGVLTVT